jgi:uncharacterized Tic20 family protein
MTTLAMLTTILVALITAVIGPLLMTWFKNKDKFEWFDAQAFEDIKSFIAKVMV